MEQPLPQQQPTSTDLLQMLANLQLQQQEMAAHVERLSRENAELRDTRRSLSPELDPRRQSLRMSTVELSHLINESRSSGGKGTAEPSKFDGRRPGTLSNWHKDIELYFIALGAPLDETFSDDGVGTAKRRRRLAQVATHLSGEAKNWFNRHQTLLLSGTWSEFKVKQQKHYGLICDAEAADQAMIRLTSRRATNYLEFIQTFNQLYSLMCDEGDVNDPKFIRISRSFFFNGLPEVLVPFVSQLDRHMSLPDIQDQISAYLVRNSHIASQVQYQDFNYPSPMDIGVVTSFSPRPTIANVQSPPPPQIERRYQQDAQVAYTRGRSPNRSPSRSYSPSRYYRQSSSRSPLRSPRFGSSSRRSKSPRNRSKYSQAKTGSLAFPRPSSPRRSSSPNRSRNTYEPPFFDGNCHDCGKYGHMAAHCPNNVRREYRPQAMIHYVPTNSTRDDVPSSSMVATNPSTNSSSSKDHFLDDGPHQYRVYP